MINNMVYDKLLYARNAILSGQKLKYVCKSVSLYQPEVAQQYSHDKLMGLSCCSRAD